MRLLYDVPTPLIVAGLLLVMLAASEAALKLGARDGDAIWQRSRDVLVALSGAMLALLGLMLAFSFSMSVDRFQARQAVLLREANAIVRVDLLADLLQPDPAATMADHLRAFAENRIAFLTVGHDPAREAAAVAASRAAQDRIWRLATSEESYREPVAVRLSLVSQAVVDLATTAREREAARARLVPEPLLYMLFAPAVLSSAMVAYMFGASGHRGRALTVTFLLLISMVVYIVIDLDRPRRGLMRLDPTPLREALAQVEGLG